MEEEMYTKYLHTEKPEDPNLEKQLGCMAGFFQLFDRHPFLTGKRFHGQKRFPAIRSYSYQGSSKPGFSSEPIADHLIPESKQHSRTESLRFEDEDNLLQCSQELNPLDGSEARIFVSHGTCPNTRHAYSPRPRLSLASGPSESSSLEVRDFVRDSLCKGSPRLSVQTDIDEKSQKKKKNSPRPLPLQWTSPANSWKEQTSISPVRLIDCEQRLKALPYQNSGDKTKMSRTQADLDASPDVRAKLTELPWNLETVRPSVEAKPGTKFSSMRDSPRFSYDERELRHTSSFKMKDPPRFSLDSRDVARDPTDRKKQKFSAGDFPESQTKRSPSVVARLMGLDEMLTDSPSTSNRRARLNLSSPAEKCEVLRDEKRSSQHHKGMDFPKQTAAEGVAVFHSHGCHRQDVRLDSMKLLNSSRHTAEETLIEAPKANGHLDLLRSKQSDMSLRPVLTVRGAVEPAPWKQHDSSHMHRKRASESHNYILDLPKRIERSYEVLCSEINGKLRQLGRENCEKVLNKQIVEATQDKRHLEDGQSIITLCSQAHSARAYEAPMVVINPTKPITRSREATQNHPRRAPEHVYPNSKGPTPTTINVPMPNSTDVFTRNADEVVGMKYCKGEVKDMTDPLPDQKGCSPVITPPARCTRNWQTPKEVHHSMKRSHSRVFPRKVSTRKSDSERKVKNESPGSLYTRRQDTKPNKTETANPSRNRLRNGKEGSRFKARFEVPRQPIGQDADETNSSYVQEVSKTSAIPDVHEHPSPISVLDVSNLDKEDSSPSPVKKCPTVLKEDEIKYCKDGKIPIAMNTKLLQNVHNLVQKLERLAAGEESSGYLELKSSDSQHQTAEYKYVEELLLASGVLCNGLDQVSTDSPGNLPLNPSLFHVLEQKLLYQFGCNKKFQQEKTDRRLIFDAVNDILQRKLHGFHSQSQEPWLIKKCKPTPLLMCNFSGQHLLKEVWGDLQQLKCSLPEHFSSDFVHAVLEKDMSMNQERWGSDRTEIGQLAIDLEKMLFKDLIDETLGLLCKKSYGYSACFLNHSGNTRRQLFFQQLD